MYRVGEPPTPVEERRSRRGLWTLLVGAAVVAFVVAVVGSAGRSAVPTGASGGSGGTMTGMAMDGGDGRVNIVARDIDGQTVRLPGSRAGAIVVIQAGACVPCLRSTRRLAAAARRVGSGLSLTAVSAAADDDRRALGRFASAAGRPPMRYLVDDRNNMLMSMLGVLRLGAIVVYDRTGKVVDTPTSSVAALAVALRRAAAPA